MPLTETSRPRLRAIDAQSVSYEGMDYLHLRDPLNLSGRIVLVPKPLIPVLTLCDGSRTVVGLQAALSLRYQLKLSLPRLEEMIAALDEAFLLENQGYAAARQEAIDTYHAGVARQPALAGQTYPEAPQELSRQLAAYISASGGSQSTSNSAIFRGLLSPHIDYERGWPVYAKTWAAAQNSVQAADLAIIL